MICKRIEAGGLAYLPPEGEGASGRSAQTVRATVAAALLGACILAGFTLARHAPGPPPTTGAAPLPRPAAPRPAPGRACKQRRHCLHRPADFCKIGYKRSSARSLIPGRTVDVQIDLSGAQDLIAVDRLQRPEQVHQTWRLNGGAARGP